MSDARAAARAAEIDRIATKLKRLPVQRRALNAAIRAFGDEFDGAEWTAAFESEETVDINRVLQVTGGYLILVNNTIEAVKIGAGLADLTPADGRRGASGLIDAVRRDGGFSREQAETFISLYATRNLLQHASTDVQARDVHRQVKLLLRSLPGFVASFTSWLARHGVELP
ncbi:MAG: hypothetical protein JSS99_08920 [Actinobacteria bacterium]|nr:hypothetical protein [Actinomycetota bacterium]